MTMFGTNPKLHKSTNSPLEQGDHTEIYTSELLDNEDNKKNKSLIGSLQWDISLGGFGIFTHVMTMSSFRSAPRQDNMDQVKRIYVYMDKIRNMCIRLQTEEPNYSSLTDQIFDWEYSVYGEVKELIPGDGPTPLVNYVRLTYYGDANLFHEQLTGCSVTYILHLVNQTPVYWYYKKQSTIETSTYSSDFFSARTCVEHIIDLRNNI